MHLCPCAQHSAFWLFPSHSYSCTRKKLLQTLHTSGWNAVIEHHCHSAPRHQGCGWHWFFAGLSPKEGNTEIYYSDCWYFSFDLLPVFWQDISSCKKTPFQTLEAHKFPTGLYTVTWHPPRTAASQIPSPVLGEAERAGPQLPSPATCALSGITKPSAIQYPCLRCKRTKKLSGSWDFSLYTVNIPRGSSPHRLQSLLSSYVPKEPQTREVMVAMSSAVPHRTATRQIQSVFKTMLKAHISSTG